MPFGLKPSCFNCKATSSTLWKKEENGDILCQTCSLNSANNGFKGDSNSSNGDPSEVKPLCGNGNGSGRSGPTVGSHFVGTIRKSARLKPSKYRYQPTTRTIATKGKSRRVIFKKNVIKAPAAVATVVTSECIFYKDQYYQVGDIVSILDEDGSAYYAQLRGFLQDQYMEKSAVITWLLPTTASPETGFDPATFILGPEEDLPRKMEYFEFVCHAPTDYFKANIAPYPTNPVGPELGYIWTSLGHHIAPAPSQEELFGLKESKPEPKEKPHKEKKEEKEKKDMKDKREIKEKKETVKEKLLVKEKDGKKDRDSKDKRSNSREKR